MRKGDDGFVNYDELANYSMSFSTLLRIDYIIKIINEATINNNIIFRIRGINSLFKEAYPFLSTDDRTTSLKFYKTINQNVNIKDDKVCFLAENLNDLDEFELWIRLKLLEKGLLFSKAEDKNFSLMGRG